MSEIRQPMSVGGGRLNAVDLDFDSCYRAVQARDARFDGWFFTAVRTTGIYCRPSCPAITPKHTNVSFHPSAAAAQRAGYRACKRCRPDASPGSPDWDVRADVVGRALRLIGDGLVDREGVSGLAKRLGYSERQIQRVLVESVGAGALALARAQRAQTARILLETTDVPTADVAFAAGFASVRQFNDTIREIFANTPSGLRAGRRDSGVSEPGTISLRLPYRVPMDLSATLGFLITRAIPAVESGDSTAFTRTIRAPHGSALVTLSAGEGHVRCVLRLADQRDLVTVVSRVRRLLDLDADPQAVDVMLSLDPQLAPLVAKRPGLRSPGAVDGLEMAVRAVVGQQISVRGARTVLGKITETFGEPAFDGEPWLLFPSAPALAAADPAAFPMPKARAETIRSIAAAIADGELVLDPGSDRDETSAALLSVRGIGPWTAEYLRMRVLGDPDVLLDSDLGVRHAASALEISLDGGRVDWAPWRSYANHHLWAALH